MRRAASLSRYLLFGNLITILLPLSFVGVWIALDYQAVVDQSIRKSNERVAEAIAGRLDEFFDRPRDALDRIAQLLMRPDLFSTGQLNDYLAVVLQSMPFLGSVEVIDDMGRVVWLAPYDPALDGISRVGDAVYEEIRASDDIYFSASYISFRNNQPALTFGRMAGRFTIQCDLDLRAIDLFASRLSREFGSEFELRITDPTGVFIYHPVKGKIREREVQRAFSSIRRTATDPFTLTLRDAGQEYLVSGVALRYPHWYVLVFTPDTIAYAPLRRLTFILILVLVGIATGALAYARLHLRRIDRGLTPIIEGTIRLSAGEFTEIRNHGGRFREFERVGDSFNLMVNSLRQRDEELRAQEARLAASLEEKEILLKEIHHRVKNNLQLISSLLALEATKSENMQACGPLMQAQQRVRSLALIHEALYTSELFDKVKFAEYVERLARDTFAQLPGGRAVVRTDLAPVTLPIDKAIPCALLLNEALTNVAKYAFPPDWTGKREVSIRIERLEGSTIRLIAADSGVGLPPGYDPEKSETLGHTIMRLLARQIRGELDIRRNSGTIVTLTFRTGDGS